MFKNKSTDWWRDQLFLAIADFLKRPNNISSAKIKSLLKGYQQQFDSHSSDEHERVMDYR